MTRVLPPAPHPCGSCPYRRDVASGVWSEEEYAKLAPFDTNEPLTVFMCHQQDGRLCAGWTVVHDMEESIGLRIACAMERITLEDLDTIRDYTTTTPLWGSGAQAAAHGMAEVYAPGGQAAKTIAKLKRKGRGE